MARRLFAVIFLSATVVLGVSCSGPDDPTNIPIGDKPGLSGPGSDGDGLIDSDGNRLPPGLINDNFQPGEKTPDGKQQK
jgi:hypothetical protein